MQGFEPTSSPSAVFRYQKHPVLIHSGAPCRDPEQCDHNELGGFSQRLLCGILRINLGDFLVFFCLFRLFSDVKRGQYWTGTWVFLFRMFPCAHRRALHELPSFGGINYSLYPLRKPVRPNTVEFELGSSQQLSRQRDSVLRPTHCFLLPCRYILCGVFIFTHVSFFTRHKNPNTWSSCRVVVVAILQNCRMPSCK